MPILIFLHLHIYFIHMGWRQNLTKPILIFLYFPKHFIHMSKYKIKNGLDSFFLLLHLSHPTRFSSPKSRRDDIFVARRDEIFVENIKKNELKSRQGRYIIFHFYFRKSFYDFSRVSKQQTQKLSQPLPKSLYQTL